MTTKRKTILIVGSSLGENSFGAPKDYLELIENLGAIPRIIMPSDDYLEGDMLLMPGGADMAPSSYGEYPRYKTGNQDVFKNHFFENKLRGYVERGMPIVGICLGMQQLAVFFGSKLTQNFIYHAQSSDGGWARAHPIFDMQFKKVGGSKFEVNSRHHQGVTLENLSAELTPLLIAENEDEHLTKQKWIVEAFKHNTMNILGIQWHPENFYDDISLSMMKKVLHSKDQQTSSN